MLDYCWFTDYDTGSILWIFFHYCVDVSCLLCKKGKKKGKDAGLLSDIKYFIRILHFYPLSLDRFIRVPARLHGEHTVLQPFRRIKFITHIAISAPPCPHFHLSQVNHLEVECLAQEHNIETMSTILMGEKYDIYLRILHKAECKTTRKVATLTKLRALTIALCPSLGRTTSWNCTISYLGSLSYVPFIWPPHMTLWLLGVFIYINNLTL